MRSRQWKRLAAVIGVCAAVGMATAGTAEAGAHQADGLIRKAGKPNFKGNDNYGAGQEVTITKPPGSTAKFEIKYQSDGAAGDLTLSIPTGSNSDFVPSVFIGKANLSSEFGDGDGLRFTNVKEGKTTPVVLYKVKITPSASPGDSLSALPICGDGVPGASGDDPNVVATVVVA